MPGYVPLLWRIFIPNATVLAVAGTVLAAEPADGRVAVLAGGLMTMLAVNVVIMRRSFAPLVRLATLMRRVDPLQPGRRLPVLGPPSEVTLVTRALNDMLGRLETERRDSARRELAIQQQERRAMARELHDELGQDLTALALQLDRLGTGRDGAEAAQIAAARDTALEAVDVVRGVARRLRPEALDELGLAPAVQQLCRRFGARADLEIEERLDAVPRLDPAVELVVYRVLQEGLTNVARHANAAHATVTLAYEGTDLDACVDDDGPGLPPGAGEADGGLRQLRERALLVGATLRLERNPRGGARVHLRVPGAA